MSEGTAPAAAPARSPRERGWTRVLLALAAFFLIPVIPPLRAIVPIEQPMLLIVPALAACFLIAWMAGGRLALAVVWVILAAWTIRAMPVEASSYAPIAAGWGLLLAGAFGIACLLVTSPAFFNRALVAVAAALAIGFAVATLGSAGARGTRRAIADEFARRNGEVIAQLQAEVDSMPELRALSSWAERNHAIPAGSSIVDVSRETLRSSSAFAVSVFPALLALQSLLVLALCWALYHRLGRTRIGAPLGRLRTFRFNDQLVWGVIVGLIALYLPTLAQMRGIGRNLLVFFGALYALRGVAVLAWFLTPGLFGTVATIAVLLMLAGGARIALPLGIAAFGLGLGDTWLDWRRPRTRPTP